MNNFKKTVLLVATILSVASFSHNTFSMEGADASLRKRNPGQETVITIPSRKPAPKPAERSWTGSLKKLWFATKVVANRYKKPIICTLSAGTLLGLYLSVPGNCVVPECMSAVEYCCTGRDCTWSVNGENQGRIGIFNNGNFQLAFGNQTQDRALAQNVADFQCYHPVN